MSGEFQSFPTLEPERIVPEGDYVMLTVDGKNLVGYLQVQRTDDKGEVLSYKFTSPDSEEQTVIRAELITEIVHLPDLDQQE